MSTSIFILFLSPFTFASTPVCLDGYFDLGPRAAAMGFACKEPADSKIAELVFCHRETLLKEGRCTGAWHRIPCEWLDENAQWECREGGDYPFQAIITSFPKDRIRYEFKSSFNEGVLEGIRIFPPNQD